MSKARLRKTDRAYTQAVRAGAGPEAKGPGVDTVNIEGLVREEAAVIKARRGRIYREPAASARHLTGLSLSGGGIRSACFNLGLLEGLDRLPYDPPPGSMLKPAADRPDKCNHLELFDYVSSVSGGSYAAGHLATAMLPPNPDPDAAPEPAEWLGKVPLTSKTVPGWLWGVGVWFLGVTFQLLKTGSLLVCFLALVAFCMRILDAPDAGRFCNVLGLGSDLARGFLPFWFALGIFLVGYWINVSKLDKWFTVAWFAYSALVVTAYVVVIWWFHDDFPEMTEPLSFWTHYAFLLALPAPVVAACVWVVVARGVKGIWAFAFKAGAAERTEGDDNTGETWVHAHYVPLRTALLAPLLVLLSCVAGLVTTGDIGLTPAADGEVHRLASEQKSRQLAVAGEWIYKAALSALGATSLAFLFPKNLFKSARQLEDRATSKGDAEGRRLKGRGWEPIYRVVVFLCSHGFVLLVIFVLYSTVAAEDVSGYYGWRQNLPSAALHPTDFRDADQAWERIARDDAESSKVSPRPSPPADWGRLAARLMRARRNVESNLGEERRRIAESRALSSMPWAVRLFPPLMHLGPVGPWEADGFQLNQSRSQLYEVNFKQARFEDKLVRRIAGDVLSLPTLYRLLPPPDRGPPPGAARDKESKEYKDLWERYRSKAEGLATLDPGQPAIQTAVRNNNRLALRLYLWDVMRDRDDKVVFAAIVWAQDQWTRLRIGLIAGVLWVLCCAVDVNSFSLQKFYRGHVIDSWVKVPQGKRVRRWLHETTDTYRGHECQGRGPGGPGRAGARRAPLLLINATLEGNRSLGDEPDLPGHVFTFSPVASGSGSTGYWLNQPDPRKSLARRSNLDVGNIVATSGGFLSPGNVANPALSAILHLLNIQTGYWAHDPRHFGARSPWESFRFHAYQSLGLDCEGDTRFMLTDGAHSENLGLYVLLQRRCSLIVVSDCSQEDGSDKADRRFDVLVQVLQQAGVDGVQVGPFLSPRAYRHWLATGRVAKDGGDRDDCRRARAAGLDLVRPPDPLKAAALATTGAPPAPVDSAATAAPAAPLVASVSSLSPAGRNALDAGEAFAQEHFVFAQVVYPPNGSGHVTHGLLVYLRPTLTGDEGDALLHGSADSRFPDDDPMDQFYTPAKMNTYRLLGRHVAEELMHDPVMKDALGRIVTAQAATKPPDHDETADARAGCTPCTKIDPSCVWNHQRTFRPPAYPANGRS